MPGQRDAGNAELFEDLPLKLAPVDVCLDLDAHWLRVVELLLDLVAECAEGRLLHDDRRSQLNLRLVRLLEEGVDLPGGICQSGIAGHTNAEDDRPLRDLESLDHLSGLTQRLIELREVRPDAELECSEIFGGHGSPLDRVALLGLALPVATHQRATVLRHPVEVHDPIPEARVICLVRFLRRVEEVVEVLQGVVVVLRKGGDLVGLEGWEEPTEL